MQYKSGLCVGQFNTVKFQPQSVHRPKSLVTDRTVKLRRVRKRMIPCMRFEPTQRTSNITIILSEDTSPPKMSAFARQSSDEKNEKKINLENTLPICEQKFLKSSFFAL